jgi:hypothetical protein
VESTKLLFLLSVESTKDSTNFGVVECGNCGLVDSKKLSLVESTKLGIFTTGFSAVGFSLSEGLRRRRRTFRVAFSSEGERELGNI